MAEFSKFLVTDHEVACPRNVYPVAVERCYRCRYFRDLRETLRGEEVICCDWIERALSPELDAIMSAWHPTTSPGGG